MKAQNDIRVTIRADKDLKEQAESLFKRMGLNMSTAINMFLRKAVDESAIPFQVSVKPPGIGYSLSADDISAVFTSAVREDIANYKIKGRPIKKLAFIRIDFGLNRRYGS